MKLIFCLSVAVAIVATPALAQRDGRGASCDSRADCSSRTDQCLPHPDGKRYCVSRDAQCAWPNIVGVAADALTCVGTTQYVCSAGKGWVSTGKTCATAAGLQSIDPIPSVATAVPATTPWHDLVAAATSVPSGDPAPASPPLHTAVDTSQAADRMGGSAPPPSTTLPSEQNVEPRSPAPPSAVATAGAPVGSIELRITADSWIRITDRSGVVLLNRVMKPGETWTAPPRVMPLLTTGNAGGTEIRIDGVALPPLGLPGTVRRDLPLDPVAIRAGRLAPPPPAGGSAALAMQKPTAR